MKYVEEIGVIYGYQRGKNSPSGNPKLVHICGQTPKLGIFTVGESSPNEGWVSAMKYSMEGSTSPMNALIRWHKTKKGKLIIDLIEEKR